MAVIFFFDWYRSERETLIENWQNGGLTTAILFMIAMNFCCVFVFFRYTCKKVVYSKYFLCVVNFLKIETISWSELQKIEYRCKKKTELILTTYDRTIVLKREILYNGWADFEQYVSDMAKRDFKLQL